jgi:hypothetical protein
MKKSSKGEKSRFVFLISSCVRRPCLRRTFCSSRPSRLGIGWFVHLDLYTHRNIQLHLQDPKSLLFASCPFPSCTTYITNTPTQIHAPHLPTPPTTKARAKKKNYQPSTAHNPLYSGPNLVSQSSHAQSSRPLPPRLNPERTSTQSVCPKDQTNTSPPHSLCTV